MGNKKETVEVKKNVKLEKLSKNVMDSLFDDYENDDNHFSTVNVKYVNYIIKLS